MILFKLRALTRPIRLTILRSLKLKLKALTFKYLKLQKFGEEFPVSSRTNWPTSVINRQPFLWGFPQVNVLSKQRKKSFQEVVVCLRNGGSMGNTHCIIPWSCYDLDVFRFKVLESERNFLAEEESNARSLKESLFFWAELSLFFRLLLKFWNRSLSSLCAWWPTSTVQEHCSLRTVL